MAGKRVLMVEGSDDEHVVKHVCGQRKLGTIEHIRQYGGKDPLIEGIGVRLKESDIHALGIILDADTDLDARWQSVAHRLRAAGYSNVPATPVPDGTIIESPTDSLLPRVGVWLMPNNAGLPMPRNPRPGFIPGWRGRKNRGNPSGKPSRPVILIPTCLQQPFSPTG